METESKIKERIKFNTEILKLFVLLMVATGGGALSLIIGGVHLGREIVLAAFGMISSIASLIVTYYQYRFTKKLIDGL